MATKKTHSKRLPSKLGAQAEPAMPSPPRLTPAEAKLLDSAGFVEASPDIPSALERTRTEMEFLLRKSHSLGAAAAALRMRPTQLRQRLRSRTLYGIKVAGTWRLPLFQFESQSRLVPHIGKVLAAISPDAHPLAVSAWFSIPHPDLIVNKGRAARRVSPREWLSAGLSTKEVVDLADEV